MDRQGPDGTKIRTRTGGGSFTVCFICFCCICCSFCCIFFLVLPLLVLFLVLVKVVLLIVVLHRVGTGRVRSGWLKPTCYAFVSHHRVLLWWCSRLTHHLPLHPHHRPNHRPHHFFSFSSPSSSPIQVRSGLRSSSLQLICSCCFRTSGQSRWDRNGTHGWCTYLLQELLQIQHKQRQRLQQ